MSYTLRGRLESRLVAVLAPLVAACALALVLERWWPVELAALMLGVGVLLDVAAYHRLLPYQAGWLAVPLGALELALVMALARLADVDAPLVAALAFFGGSWALAQVLGHALFPLVRLTYGEDGGELGRTGALAAGATLGIVALVGGVAWATAPPTITLEAGVHRGPLVLDHEQILVGEPGAVVEGGIVVTADGVHVRDVTVVGGEHGIVVENAEGVVLDGVEVRDTRLDAIHARRSTIEVRDCRIGPLRGAYAQGIDVSFAYDLAPSVVRDCSVTGGREGIVSFSSHVEFRDNLVTGTALRGIAVNEMSDGVVADNRVHDATGVGIFCADYSHCEISENSVSDIRPDATDPPGSLYGYGIVVHYGSKAIVSENRLAHTAGIGTFAEAQIVTR